MYNINIITIKKEVDEIVIPRNKFGHLDYTNDNRPFIFISEDNTAKTSYRFFRQKINKKNTAITSVNPWITGKSRLTTAVRTASPIPGIAKMYSIVIWIPIK